MIKECTNLQYLNISDTTMKKKNCAIIVDAIADSVNSGSRLNTILWNFTLQKTTSNAKNLITKLADAKNCSLKHLSLTGTFQSKENRDAMRELLKDSGIELVLFKPDYTDDESEDHDNSEEESVASDQ